MSKNIDYAEIKEIKKLAIRALCSDDYLMEKLVLKGGTCIEAAYQISSRASKDIDFSIESAFNDQTLEEIRERIELQFIKVFESTVYYPFDINIIELPANAEEDNIMSGYVINFKLIEREKFIKYSSDSKKLSREALPIANNKATFAIEISKHEFCKHKELKEIDGCKVYVYTPRLIIFEKLRAICQKMKEYPALRGLERNDEPRSRDFYDIESINENLAHIDFKNAENRQILKLVFDAKKVPLEFLGRIKDKYQIHKDDFQNITATEAQKSVMQSYQFYFDYVLNIIDELDEFWIK